MPPLWWSGGSDDVSVVRSAGGTRVSESGAVLGRGESPEAAATEAALFHPQRGVKPDGLPSHVL